MLQRYCKLVEELSILDQRILADLSTEEITRYLDLRKEQEELAGSIWNLISDSLLNLQDLVTRIKEELIDLPEVMQRLVIEAGFRGLPLNRLAMVVGVLEADMKRILADCRQLRYEFFGAGEHDRQGMVEEGRKPLSDQAGEVIAGDCEDTNYKTDKGWGNADEQEEVLKQHKVLNEVACAWEVGEFLSDQIPKTSSAMIPGQHGGKPKNEDKHGVSGVSQETLKKLETIMCPKNAVEVTPFPWEKEGNLAIIKVATPVAGKTRHNKANKERDHR